MAKYVSLEAFTKILIVLVKIVWAGLLTFQPCDWWGKNSLSFFLHLMVRRFGAVNLNRVKFVTKESQFRFVFLRF